MISSSPQRCWRVFKFGEARQNLEKRQLKVNLEKTKMMVRWGDGGYYTCGEAFIYIQCVIVVMERPSDKERRILKTESHVMIVS